MLVTVACLPSLPLYLAGASSMAIGVVLACMILLFNAFRLYPDRPLQPGTTARWLALVWVGVGVHAVVAVLLGPFDMGRFLGSWVLLIAFLLGARALVTQVFEADPRCLHRALRWVLGVLVVCALLGILEIAPPGARPYSKPFFPFTEPSHLGLAFTPVLMYVAISARGWRRWGWIAGGLAIALAVENMTCLVGALLVALVCALRSAAVLLPLATLSLAPLLGFEYYLYRLEFSEETRNLSALVYVQGWQLIEESLGRTAGWGLGFQQLGVHGTDVPFASVIQALIDDVANLNDGGFTLSKLVSEFGVFGILLALAHLKMAWGCARRLHQHGAGTAWVPVPVRLASAVVVAFSVELFIRGGGYFTASSLLYVASLIYLIRTSPHLQTAALDRRKRKARCPLPLQPASGHGDALR